MKRLLTTFLFLPLVAYSVQGQSSEDSNAQAIAAFSRLLKSETQARKMVANLCEYADSAAWKCDAVLSVAQRLLVRKFSESDVYVLIVRCSDAVAAIDGDESDLAILVGRMAELRGSSKSEPYYHISAIDSLGLPAWEMIAEAIGKSVDDTKSLASSERVKGQGAYDVLTTWFHRRYAGMAKDTAKKRRREN